MLDVILLGGDAVQRKRREHSPAMSCTENGIKKVEDTRPC